MRTARSLFGGLAVGLVLLSVAPAAGAGGGAPLIEGVTVSHITRTSARLEAVIQANGSGTTYQLWVRHQPGCAPKCEIAYEEYTAAEGSIAAGHTRRVTATTKELPLGTEVEVWAVATNSSGTTETNVRGFKLRGRPKEE